MIKSTLGNLGLFTILGIPLELMYLTSPVHEFGHVLMGWILGHQTTMHFRSTTYYPTRMRPDELIAFMYAGVGFEIVFFSLLALSVASKKVWLAGLSLGVVISAYVTAMSLSDIRTIKYVGIEAFYAIAGIFIFTIIVPTMYCVKHTGLSEEVV